MSGLKLHREIHTLDFWLSGLVMALNELLARVPGWDAARNGFRVELEERGKHEDGVRYVAFIFPSNWPASSRISVRIDEYKNGSRQMIEGAIWAPHILVNNEPLDMVRFEVCTITGFLRVQITDEKYQRLLGLVSN